VSATPRRITIFTHSHPEETWPAVEKLIDAAAAAGVEVQVPVNEIGKYEDDGTPSPIAGCEPDAGTDVAVVFGGDGTILTALRACSANNAPVFAFNYGAIGFLSTLERDALDEGIRRVLEGDFEVLPMPALAVDLDGTRRLGINDISLHRRSSSSVAEIGYSVIGDQLGRVRCDGLVAATPVGSTGYNLANGGPILAWGVEGFVVSFIAPHTLTARALVVAPDDALTVQNLGRESVDVMTDNRPVAQLQPESELEVRFLHDQVRLAQVPGSTFYHRIREKFGRLTY
jgi:NAD+ kinase